MSSPAKCRSCGAEIEWVTMRDTGKQMPLDVGPGSTTQAIDVRADGAGAFGVMVTGRRPHWSTCPSADEHRKQKPASSTAPAILPDSTVRMPIVDDEVRELILRQVVGAGGFQNLLLDLRNRSEWKLPGGDVKAWDPLVPLAGAKLEHLERGLQAELVAVNAPPAILDRIVRYAGSYGDGGYQGRLRTLIPGLRAIARALGPLNDGGAQRKLTFGEH